MALPPRDQRHRYAQGQIVFTSRAWRCMFDIRGLLVHELILEFFSTFRFGELGRCRLLDSMHTGHLVHRSLGCCKDDPSLMYLSQACSFTQWYSQIGISSVGDFLGTTSSYTSIRDLILRLCHRLIVCSVAGRSQAPEKATVTDLFYLRGMDIGLVNVLYLLARYLRLFDARRKSKALISGGQFVARLAEHFGLLTEEKLRGLTIIAPALPVSLGPEKQPNAAAGAPGAVEDAVAVDEGPRERNIDEYWWSIYKSGDLEVLES
ncbi:hypothetical protein Tco_0779057 [Tanacetum coccineum]